MADESMVAGLRRLHAAVKGRVQGVGFRAYVANRGIFLGLTGWVRNTASRTVEVVAEGRQQDLDVLMNALWKGPGGAQVDEVLVEWQPATGEFSDFDIVHGDF